MQGLWSEAERGGWHGFWIPKKELVTDMTGRARRFLLLYACIIYRWRNECYVFGTVLIDEETITAYREQDASLVMICVICRARRTYALPKRWWNARTMIYRLEIKRSRLEIGVEMIKIVYKNINISFFQKTSNTLESKCLSIKIIYYSNWLFKISEFN